LQLLFLLQAELKEANEQGAEIGEAESTITEVEAVVKPTEE
jgi:tubulin-specific chaperone A